MSSRFLSYIFNIIRLIYFFFLLYCFLIAVSLLGDSFKLLGKGVVEGLIATTSNSYSGLMIGILTTAIVQSSSFTTSLVVALVSGGALSVSNAIPIIMGANIGTTITCSIVSLGHIRRGDEFARAYAGATIHDIFNILSVLVLFPLQLTTNFLGKASAFLASIVYGSSAGSFDSPLKTIVKPVVKFCHHLLMDNLSFSEKVAGIVSIIASLFLIFYALASMVTIMRKITATRMEHWIQKIFSANIYIILLIGLLVTAIIQSSSITTSMIIPMLGAGLITIEQAFPITVGANIGTTVTALMAALAGNQMGLTIAFVHLLFNVCGTMIFFVPPFMRRIPLFIVRVLVSYCVCNKKFVFVYLATVFFIIPIVAMLISRM